MQLELTLQQAKVLNTVVEQLMKDSSVLEKILEDDKEDIATFHKVAGILKAKCVLAKCA